MIGPVGVVVGLFGVVVILEFVRWVNFNDIGTVYLGQDRIEPAKSPLGDGHGLGSWEVQG